MLQVYGTGFAHFLGVGFSQGNSPLKVNTQKAYFHVNHRMNSLTHLSVREDGFTLKKGKSNG